MINTTCEYRPSEPSPQKLYCAHFGALLFCLFFPSFVSFFRCSLLFFSVFLFSVFNSRFWTILPIFRIIIIILMSFAPETEKRFFFSSMKRAIFVRDKKNKQPIQFVGLDFDLCNVNTHTHTLTD